MLIHKKKKKQFINNDMLNIIIFEHNQLYHIIYNIYIFFKSNINKKYYLRFALH